MPAAQTPEALQPLDIQRERSNCSFDGDAMSCIYTGSKEARDHARWLFSLLQDYPGDVFRKAKEARPFQGRRERFQAGQQVTLAYWTIRNREGLSKPDRDALRLYVDEYLPLQVLESMFAPTIQTQASEEQWKEWGPHVVSGRWTGCYAQTELANGSNLSRLKTTATLDRNTDEWVIQSPQPSAGKIWIGGSGVTATHGMVMAQMVIGEKSYGLHPFLVPFRSLQTHRLLPGVTIMDQGPKLGAPAMDNGYITFDRVRIPRTNLLARFQGVDKGGNYQLRNESAKVLTRGTMTLVRVGLVEIAAHHLSRATLIAIRYAIVRRQGSGKLKDALEPQILDYAGVQQRLFTALASSYALTFTGRHLRSIYSKMIAELEASGKSPLLPIVHGFSSILKACTTNESLAGIERCRRSMGGHGYSLASGIAGFEVNQPNAGLTYEGDNNMLLGGPAANFLVKMLVEANKTGRVEREELAFLLAKSPVRFSSLEDLLALVGYRCKRLTEELSQLRSGAGQKPAAVLAHLDSNLAMRASRAAGSYLILFAFARYLDILRRASASSDLARREFGCSISPAELAALENLALFYSIEVCILSELGDYTEDGALNATQVSQLRERSAECMAKMRSDALGLAEACDMHDDYLASPLGSSDGRAYERFIEWMKKEPLNQTGADGGRDENGVVKGWKEGLGKLIAGQVVPFDEKKGAEREKTRTPKRASHL